ncbi:16S rRNA (uracil(1498)-N(3))-methyltransferase [Candidatus Woesearchaeota archaeon]|nr:16S rRNA (uracil(1498)-N(3))-methyltransferase [Candidatus Woesearchaeota archaeon]
MRNNQEGKTNEVHSGKVRVRMYHPEAKLDKEITLTGEQTRHIKVLRMQEGQRIRVFDGQGHEYEGVYSEKVRPGKLKLEQTVVPNPEPKTHITLAVAAPKGGRLDVLVEKVSELGVRKLVPIICSRSVVKPKETKIERLRKIAIEAACQSERTTLLEISEPTPFATLLEKVREYNHSYLCHKSGTPLSHADIGESVLLIVGPEGDFTEAEMQAALEAGCQKVSLAPTVLRTETAGITAAAQTVGISQKLYK